MARVPEPRERQASAERRVGSGRIFSHGPVLRLIRRSVVVGTISASLLGTISSHAFASSGCTAVNGGGFNDSLSATAGQNLSNTKTIAGFAIGDTVNFTVTFAFTASWTLKSGSGATVNSTDSTAGGSQTEAYTVTGNNQDTTLSQIISASAIPSAVSPSTVNVTATCSAGASGASPGTNASQNLRSLQSSITTMVASTSGAIISNAIDSGINDAFSSNGTPTSFGPNGGFINFAAPEPRSETATRTDEAFAALGYAGGINGAPNFNKAPPLLDRQWSAWVDLRGTGWRANDTTGNGNDLKGNQFNLTAGISRKLTADTVVGVIAGYENFKYDVAALAGSVKGDGETIGGYFAQRFGSSLRFDAAVAWSNVNYSATAGNATGSFTGSRWLASTGLTGYYKNYVYVVEPSARVYALWESENAWTDSLGTLQPSRHFSAGRTALGAKVARPFAVSNGWTLSPYAGIYGDWRFQSDNALPTATPVANIGTGWSGRVTGGLAAKAAGGCIVSLDGEYGGLGASYKIWTGHFRASMPF